MSKRRNGNRSQLTMNRRGRRKVFIVVGLIVGLLAASAALARWSGIFAAGQKSGKPGSVVTTESLTPGSPSKEYVYAGSKLIATEEPAQQSGNNNAAFVTQSVPSTMTAGQSYSVSVSMSNTGTTTWTAGAYLLGSQNPPSNATWGLSQVNLSASVAPGAQTTFSFTVTAPATAGNYNFQWQMQQSGVGYFGAASTNVLISVATGGSGDRSLLLNGTSAYVSVPNSASLNITGTITVEAWIKTNSATAQQGIIERYGTTGTGTTDGGYSLRLSSGFLQFFTLKNGNEGDVIQSVSTVTTGVWHHVAGVFDGSQLRVYIDGALNASKASTFAPFTGTNSLKIGARGDDGTTPFNGLIDEARVTTAAVYTSNFTPSAHLAAVTGTKGLWKFDGQTASDSSGNGNHGTLLGGAGFSTDVPAGSSPSYFSLSLNGTSAYVSVPNSTSLNITGAITVEAWIKTNSATAQQGIVERYSTSGVGTTNGGYALRLSSGFLQFFTLKNGNEFDYLQSVSTISTGAWHHVAAVEDGSQLRVYIDGALNASKASTFAPFTGTFSLKIGARGDDGTIPFNGLIDEARVTAAVVYVSNFTPSAHLAVVSGTAGLWKFDGQTASDSSGNGNNGSLLGGAGFSTDVPN
jgi:Concanavalin A-like lectin/glucanases superfamily/Ig-like domain from next to BRCA1 gene